MNILNHRYIKNQNCVHNRNLVLLWISQLIHQLYNVFTKLFLLCICHYNGLSAIIQINAFERLLETSGHMILKQWNYFSLHFDLSKNMFLKAINMMSKTQISYCTNDESTWIILQYEKLASPTKVRRLFRNQIDLQPRNGVAKGR